MSENNSTVAIFNSHTEAEGAVRELKRSGLDIKKLSIVGKDYHTNEQVVGYYNTTDRMMYWGKNGAFWGGLYGMGAPLGALIVSHIVWDNVIFLIAPTTKLSGE